MVAVKNNSTNVPNDESSRDAILTKDSSYPMNSAITPEVIQERDLVLSNSVTKGLVPDQVEALKERILDINDECEGIGQGIKAIAANLYEIKQNIKGNWKAFLESGVINMSPRSAIDLVSAYDKWLGNTDIDNHIISGLSYRSLAILGGTPKKPVTENQRQKVFELVASGEKVKEYDVRRLTSGRTNKTAPVSKEAPDATQREARLQAEIEKYKATIKILKDENKKLKNQIASSDKTEKMLEEVFS